MGVQAFNRFWVQAVRHLLEGGTTRGRSRGRLTTDKEKYGPGDTVQHDGGLSQSGAGKVGPVSNSPGKVGRGQIGIKKGVDG